ncbi:MAG: hypothetical protein V8R74_03495 [Clostridia bacterium]
MDFYSEEFRKKEESDDLLFEAYDEPNEAEAIKLAKKALELNPENIDAENFITEHEKKTIKKLERYEATLNKEKARLDKEEYFSEENMGGFWRLIGTRPFMRTKRNYMLTFMSLGRYTNAIKQGEELLELNESDNQGIRYMLMGLYTILERFEDAEKLYKKYSEGSAFMLLPLAIMYYKKGDYNKSKKILKKLKESNEFVIDFLTGARKLTKAKINKFEAEEAFDLRSEAEAYFVIKDYGYLLAIVPSFSEFII